VVIQAYRKISLTEHPDKNRAENATEVYRAITKAYEVLSGNESKPLFDYYLDHPRVSDAHR
jgi:DnaJ-class molecular chaperone